MIAPRHGQPVVGGRAAVAPSMSQHPQHGHPQPAHPAVHPAHPVQRPGIAPMPVQPVVHEELEPIGLVDEIAGVDGGSKITAFGVSMGGGPTAHKWKRTPHVTGTGICRVKSFHGRLSDQGMDYLDGTINEWLDAHPEVEVKMVTTNTNIFDGKMKELALIVNIWY